MAEKKTPKVVKETKAPAKAQEPEEQPHYVFIGQKGAMAYVLAVETQFGQGAREVIIKARGKSISRAVDVAEIMRNKYPIVKLESIGISTEEVVTEDGRPLKISAIEIILSQQ